MTTDYNLDSLGWWQFERLCQALLRAEYGANVEAWGGSGDLGRDAYAAGPLRFPDPSVMAEGPFVFQAKFVSGASSGAAKARASLMTAVRAERDKIEDRIDDGLWEPANCYALMTNVPLNKTSRDALRAVIKEALPDTNVVLEGDADIGALLDSNPAVRVSYPQILGIRDLKSLLDGAVSKDIVERSQFALAAAAELATVFVPTMAYNEALRLLRRRGFAVLLGPPEMGKTATASIIALAQHTAGWEVYDCRRPDDVFRVHNSESKQIYLADDAFGSTEYRPDVATAWAADLDSLIRLTDDHHWLIWTSRPAPLREGLRVLHLQGKAEDFPSPQEIQVDAARLSVAEKAQILYRHAKARNLSPEGTELVRKYARSIVGSPQFTPFRIKRFVSDHLPDVLLGSSPNERAMRMQKAIREGLRTPTQPLTTSFNVLDDERRAVLVALLNADPPTSIESVRVMVERYLGRPTLISLEALIESIDDHFLRSSVSEAR